MEDWVPAGFSTISRGAGLTDTGHSEGAENLVVELPVFLHFGRLIQWAKGLLYRYVWTYLWLPQYVQLCQRFWSWLQFSRATLRDEAMHSVLFIASEAKLPACVLTMYRCPSWVGQVDRLGRGGLQIPDFDLLNWGMLRLPYCAIFPILWTMPLHKVMQSVRS